MSLPTNREECEALLETARIWTNAKTGTLEMPSGEETMQLIALARLGARVAYPSEETVNAIARAIYYPFAEPYKPQGPGDPGVAVFQPMPDWCVERARAALTSLKDD